MDNLKLHNENDRMTSLQSGQQLNTVIATKMREIPVSNLGAPEQVLKAREGDLIFSAGEMPKGLYYLKSGAVKLVTERPLTRGRMASPEFINKIVSPGEFFGFKSLIRGTAYPFYARALRETEVQIFPSSTITQIMSGTDSLIKAVLEQMAEDLEVHEQTAQLHYLASVQERIAYQLAILAERFGVPVVDGLSLNLRLNRNELAQLAGTINESFSRHLTELKNEGVIDVRGKEIIVKNLMALKEKSGNYEILK